MSHLSWTSRLRQKIAPKYKYKPLGQHDDLRLIKLDPNAKGVVCRIIHASFEQEYVALSYTWQNPNPVTSNLNGDEWETYPTITCNGHKLKVQRNLFEALEMLKSFHESRCLWIDAICVDQGNHGELLSQLPRMGDIYAAASEVLVWLGSEDETTASAASNIAQTFAYLERSRQLGSMDSTTLLSGPLEQPPDDLVDLDIGKAIYHLFARAWFRRGWVVQEAALAKKCRVLCGKHEFALEAIWCCALLYSKIETLCQDWVELDTLGVYKGGSKGILLFSQLFATRLEVQGGGYQMEKISGGLKKRYDLTHDSQLPFAYLLDLLLRSKWVEFKVPADRLIAPLALVRTLYSRHNVSTAVFELDRLASMDAVQITISRLLIEQTGSLAILSFGGPSIGGRSLPSWVPQLEIPTSDLYQDGFDATCGWIPSDRLLGKKLFNTSGTTIPESNLNLLPIQAILFDEIKVQTTMISRGVPDLIHTSEWFRLLESLASHCPWTGDSRLEALSTTILAGHFALDTLSRSLLDDLEEDWFESCWKEEMQDAYDLYLKDDFLKAQHAITSDDTYRVVLPICEEEFFRRNLELQSFRLTFSMMAENSTWTELAQGLSGLVSQAAQRRWYFQKCFRDIYGQTAAGRRIAQTQQKALCLVPAKSLVGDRVAFLRGSKLPFILRSGSVNGHFTLIGQAYVHGFMTGKIMQMKLESQSIYLE